jgi:hypothetical protein
MSQYAKKELNMVIADRLRALREQKNLSQGDIEKRAGLLRHRRSLSAKPRSDWQSDYAQEDCQNGAHELPSELPCSQFVAIIRTRAREEAQTGLAV